MATGKRVELNGFHREQFLLHLTAQILEGLPAQMRKADMERAFGAASLHAGNLLIRGVSASVATEAAAAILSMPAEIAGDFVSSLDQMIREAELGDESGDRFGIQIGTLADYSAKADWMQEMHHVTTAGGAFTLRDYDKCAQECEKGLLSYPKALLFQLLVISLQRLGKTEEAEAHGQRAMSYLIYDPWHQCLMAITVGMVEANEVYGAATDENQRCQARFYEGVRHLTCGRDREAKTALAECRASSSDMLEKGLAGAEMEAIS